MEIKELKVQAPEGYEIDAENSTFECIKFKPIKKDITYEDICNKILKSKINYYINTSGRIEDTVLEAKVYDKNNATNKKQLERLLALNQLLNIAKYYNKLHPTNTLAPYTITGLNNGDSMTYKVDAYNLKGLLFGVVVLFNNKEDAQAVIDNPNFREILDIIYKD